MPGWLARTFSLTTIRAFAPVDLAPYPAIRSYLRRTASRPTFERAMKKADLDLQIPLG